MRRINVITIDKLLYERAANLAKCYYYTKYQISEMPTASGRDFENTLVENESMTVPVPVFTLHGIRYPIWYFRFDVYPTTNHLPGFH